MVSINGEEDAALVSKAAEVGRTKATTARLAMVAGLPKLKRKAGGK